jgi:hypothetical protein
LSIDFLKNFRIILKNIFRTCARPRVIILKGRNALDGSRKKYYNNRDKVLKGAQK